MGLFFIQMPGRLGTMPSLFYCVFIICSLSLTPQRRAGCKWLSYSVSPLFLLLWAFMLMWYYREGCLSQEPSCPRIALCVVFPPAIMWPSVSSRITLLTVLFCVCSWGLPVPLTQIPASRGRGNTGSSERSYRGIASGTWTDNLYCFNREAWGQVGELRGGQADREWACLKHTKPSEQSRIYHIDTFCKRYHSVWFW